MPVCALVRSAETAGCAGMPDAEDQKSIRETADGQIFKYSIVQQFAGARSIKDVTDRRQRCFRE
jgi:hypothetical protein